MFFTKYDMIEFAGKTLSGYRPEVEEAMASLHN